MTIKYNHKTNFQFLHFCSRNICHLFHMFLSLLFFNRIILCRCYRWNRWIPLVNAFCICSLLGLFLLFRREDLKISFRYLVVFYHLWKLVFLLFLEFRFFKISYFLLRLNQFLKSMKQKNFKKIINYYWFSHFIDLFF